MLRLPRPALVNIEAVLRAVETGPVDEEKFLAALKELDGKLADAAVRDMRALLSAVLSRLGGRRTAQANGYRTRQILTCFGWIPVRFAYVRKAGAVAFLTALGVTARSTAAARDRVVRCAALCGSFAEGRGMLRQLTGIDISISKVRALALAYGEQCLRMQDQALPDVRSYPVRAPKDGETGIAHTLFCMLDGTGAPCTKKDTAGSKGKNGEAGTRQIRVAVFGEYDRLDKHGRPSPVGKSFPTPSPERISPKSRDLSENSAWRGGTERRRVCNASRMERMPSKKHCVMRSVTPSSPMTSSTPAATCTRVARISASTMRLCEGNTAF